MIRSISTEPEKPAASPSMLLTHAQKMQNGILLTRRDQDRPSPVVRLSIACCMHSTSSSVPQNPSPRLRQSRYQGTLYARIRRAPAVVPVRTYVSNRAHPHRPVHVVPHREENMADPQYLVNLQQQQLFLQLNTHYEQQQSVIHSLPVVAFAIILHRYHRIESFIEFQRELAL